MQTPCLRTRKTQAVKRRTQAKLRFTFHAIQREVQDPLAMALLQGEFTESSKVRVDYREETVVFKEDVPEVESEIVAA